jgi:hypothetical protein
VTPVYDSGYTPDCIGCPDLFALLQRDFLSFSAVTRMLCSSCAILYAAGVFSKINHSPDSYREHRENNIQSCHLSAISNYLLLPSMFSALFFSFSLLQSISMNHLTAMP